MNTFLNSIIKNFKANPYKYILILILIWFAGNQAYNFMYAKLYESIKQEVEASFLEKENSYLDMIDSKSQELQQFKQSNGIKIDNLESQYSGAASRQSERLRQIEELENKYPNANSNNSNIIKSIDSLRSAVKAKRAKLR